VTFTAGPTQLLQWTELLLTFPVAGTLTVMGTVRSPQNETYGGRREGNACDSFQTDEYKVVII
jgi:hypothetical protein